MSKTLFLCGQTGSDNRGCEAIVRSTVKAFSLAGLKEKPVLATYSMKQDKSAKLDELAKLVAYSGYGSKLKRYFYAALRKISRDPLVGQSIIQKSVWDSISVGDLSLAIGGDTYCYKAPTGFIAHNIKLKKLGVPSVLWCCSIGEEYIKGDVKRDLMNYTLIVARESYTYENLVKAGIKEDKIIKCCDPAFLLDIKECELPQSFNAGNTVGLNLSSLVNNPQVMRSAKMLVDRILEETDMQVCLIPHVYSTEPESGDLELLREFYENYSFTGRVAIVDKPLSCEELKYIISKCRFFVGARTHSTIAAYSTGVPTLVLGYSVKSLGIARDLFGSEEGYVLPYTEIESDEDIWQAFSGIAEKEKEIKDRLNSILPDYIKTVQDTASELHNKFLA